MNCNTRIKDIQEKGKRWTSTVDQPNRKHELGGHTEPVASFLPSE